MERESGRSLFDKVMNNKVTDLYFTPKFFEKNGIIYKRLGVRLIKQHLPLPSLDPGIHMFRKHFKSNLPGFSLRKPTIEDAKKFESLTRLYEAIHMVGVIGPAEHLTSSLLGEKLTLSLSSSVLTAAFIVNLYGFMIQRYNRSRIYTIIRKK